MNLIAIRLAAIGAGALLLTAAYHRTPSSGVMASAANAFLNSLADDQKAKATFSFTDDERLNWHFIPIARKGLPLREMTPPQKHLAQALLAAGLSQAGYMKAVTIMSLEDVLRLIEKDSGVRRNPEGYFFSIFGEPSDSGTWGYRVEGHHMAQNFTIVNGKVIGAPSFYGSNPAEIREGPRKGLRALAGEEDLGRDVVMALTAEQRKTAVVAGEAYKDILTSDMRKAELKDQPMGLPAAQMTSKQYEALSRLVEEYAFNLSEPLAAMRMEQFKKAGKNLRFAWAGPVEKGQKHYYRVQAPTFLIEYDNTQNDGNHVHSVWRDYAGDFGVDLLGEHLRQSHR